MANDPTWETTTEDEPKWEDTSAVATEEPSAPPKPPLMDFGPTAVAKATANLGVIPKSAGQVESEIAAAQTVSPISPEMATTAIRTSPLGAAATQASNLSDMLFGTKTAPIVEGATAGAGELASGFLTPGNVSLGVGTAGAGKVGELALGAYFAAHAAKEAPELWRQYQATDDPAEKSKLLVELAGEVAAPTAILGHTALRTGLSLSDTLFRKPIPEEVIPSATQEGIKPESNQPEHPGVPPGTNISENIPEVRQGEGEQAGSRGGVQPSAEVPQEVTTEEQPTAPEPPEAGKRADVIALAEAEKPPQAGEAEPTAELPGFGIASPLQSIPGLGPTIAKLDTFRKSFVTLFKARPTRAVISGTYDAIDNQARIAGQQVGNSAKLEIAGTKMDRQAMTPIVEAQGDVGKLKEMADKVNASGKASPEMKGIYNYAVNNFERLEPKRAVIDNLHAKQLATERASGINTDEVSGYVAHRYDMDLMTPGKPLVLDSTGGKGGSSSFFKKQRVYPDYASAIADGYIPRTMDVSDLADHRINAGQKLINQRQWIDSLRTEINPVDGNPVVTDLIKQPKGTFVPPPGYVTREPAPGVRVAVNEYFAPIVDALTAQSHVPAIAKNIAAGIKHGNLLIDTFHASRLGQMELGLMGKVGYRKGLSLLEYGDDDLAKAVKGGEITQEMSDYAKTNRPVAEGMIKQGLNVGGISDALYKDVLESIPGFKQTLAAYNKWLFDKFNRGVIMESAIYMRDRNAQLHPELDPTALDKMSAREANVYYRNLRSQGIFKSKTWQDAMRVVFLAPQWVEGMVTSELKGYGQALKVPYDAATKGQFLVGNVAKGMGTGLAAYMVGTQLLNLLTRGKPTWENPEQGQKWNAFVPDFLQSSNGFFLAPFSVFAEMTHDLFKYGQTTPNKVDVPVKIATNKLSAVSRAFRDVTIGKDFFGKPLDTAWDRAKQAAIDLAPIPIGARALTAQYAGSQQRQAASQVGIKLDVAPSAGREISQLATEFKAKQGIKTDSTTSDYRDLKRALMDGNMDTAHKEYDKLLATKKPAKGTPAEAVAKYFDKVAEAPFTGSKTREDQFRTGLDRQQLEIYNRAKDDQSTIRTRFFQMTQTTPGKKPFALKNKK